ncbi:amino acid adenylation domain-containing protein [Xenorhabdus sp. 18]|uniref:non-ribosomal peptide synthetase n=1 Tax=Xenorhabdus doucetiae TaxID=351671 RepID=UPI00199ADAC3|nr:amino acid adenylation domain-containing protein [Xenorhabdus sp. 18]MBD2797477.1 amino acid adenylation domain-containing protein [Xenorhabdus sp. 18]
MKVSQLVLSLMEKGISLSISKGNLIYKSLYGEPDPSTLALLKQHKESLLAFFKALWQRVEQTERDFPAQGAVEIAPLSFSQKLLWITEQLGAEEQVGQYNITGVCRLKGAIDTSAIHKGLEALLERQPVLRTVIIEESELGIIQVVRENVSIPLQQQDFSGHKTHADEYTEQVIHQEVKRPFNLAQDLMLRVNLLKYSENEYVLVFTMHHIASDGWSMNVLISEFGALYNAFAHRRENPLPSLPLHYTDYARWQRYSAIQSDYQEKLDYWKNQLRDIPPVHAIPLDFPRPSKQRFYGASYDATIEPFLTERFEALCHQHDATLFMGLHAVFSVLLARYSGEKDIVVGTPVANRERIELENLIGFFVNTMVLRVDLSGDPTFEQLLLRSKTCISDAFTHILPLSQILESVQMERTLSYSPLFQIMLSLQSTPQHKIQLDEIDIQILPITRDSVKFDLALDIEPSSHGLRLKWEYNTDLFSALFIEQMAQHFSTLFRLVVANPKMPLFNHPLLSESEKNILLEWGHAHAEEVPPVKHTLVDFLQEQAVLYPQAIALVCNKASLSYHELVQWAIAGANTLTLHGIQSGDVVGVCTEKSFEWVSAMYAIWMCGAIYLPIAPNTPSQRVEFMLRDAGASLLLFDSEGDQIAKALPESQRKLALTDVFHSLDNTELGAVAINEFRDHSAVAYLIYTSGTTGKPKGVIISHLNVANVLSGVAACFNIGPDTVMPAIASIAFDISLFEVITPLMKGGRVMLYRHQEVTNIPQLVSDISEWTGLHAVPALMNAILDECDHLQIRPAKLRQLFIGGDNVPDKILRRLRKTFFQQDIIELYGPTECTILSTAFQMTAQDKILRGSIIGRPLPHAKIYILNETGNLVPRGVVGELCIGGVGVAAGYLNRNHETELHFRKEVVTSADMKKQGRLYHTGDLARWLSDGNLEFLGRKDHQIKMRGYRIELGEIEALLCQRDDISQALVTVQNSHDSLYLVAYVIGEGARHSEMLRSWLAEQLPDYMVPTAYCELTSLPLNVNGKVDRSMLPSLVLHNEVTEYIAPRNEREKVLCQIWQQVLGIERVGIHDEMTFSPLADIHWPPLKWGHSVVKNSTLISRWC